MDFVTDFLISMDWKQDSYNFILIIVERLTKMVYNKLVQVTLDTANLAEMIMNVII